MTPLQSANLSVAANDAYLARLAAKRAMLKARAAYVGARNRTNNAYSQTPRRLAWQAEEAAYAAFAAACEAAGVPVPDQVL